MPRHNSASATGDGASPKRKVADAGEDDTDTIADGHLGITAKVLAVLEALAASPRPLTMPELVAASQLKSATAYRLCKMLLKLGLIEHDGARRYREGKRFLALCHATLAAAAQRSIRNVILRALSDAIGENCHYSIQDGAETVSIDYAESTQALDIRLRPGLRCPLHANASGKLMLARMPSPARERLIERLPLAALTRRTITSKDALLAEIRRIERRDYATSEEESIEGVMGIAVPVLDSNRKFIGTVLVTAPVSRRSMSDLKAHLPRIRQAAADLGQTY